MDVDFEIKRAKETGKVVMGYRQVEKLALNGKLKLVIVAKNAPKEKRKRVEALVKVYEYPGTNMELGTVCGRPHGVSFLGIADPGESRILEAVS